MSDGQDRRRWARVEPATWTALASSFLGHDNPDERQVRRILVRESYQPDSFTVSERLAGSVWLDPAERDAHAWLRALVARRLPATPDDTSGLRRAATEHVLGETMRVLNYRTGGLTVAESLWNQEIPYLIDRIISWCLYGTIARYNDVTRGFNELGLDFVGTFLARYADHLDLLDTAGLTRVSIAAGLLGLDEKGGPARCQPIRLPRPRTALADLSQAWQRLSAYAQVVPAVDDIDALLDQVGSGQVRLVWWFDDLIETAFDLLVIQRVLAANPRLHVTVVPKNGQYDNDASSADVRQILQLPCLRPLHAALAAERLTVCAYGPRMATANPLKLHPTVIDAIAACDLMVCKGGRVHEMLSGNVNKRIYTAYVVVRPFTEAQAGVDSSAAPLMLFGAEPGEWPWWGFNGRAERTLTLPTGRTIAACYTTVAEHAAHRDSGDQLMLAEALVQLVHIWPALRVRYGIAARAEIRLLHDRLTARIGELPPSIVSALHDAHTISTTGEPVHARPA